MAAVIFAVLSGVVPALVWLWFWLREDKTRPEPKPLIGEIFLLGALAVIPAFYLERYVGLPQSFAPSQSLWQLLLVWAIIEEGLKFVVVCLGALPTRFYDEPVDAMIYMVTAAVGFAAVENTLFIFSALSKGSGADYILTAQWRFLGATLVHIVASALVGTGIGISFYGQGLNKLFCFLAGFAAAVGLHTLFNYFILISDPSHPEQIFKIFGLLWLGGLLIILFFEHVKHGTKKIIL